ECGSCGRIPSDPAYKPMPILSGEVSDRRVITCRVMVSRRPQVSAMPRPLQGQASAQATAWAALELLPSPHSSRWLSLPELASAVSPVRPEESLPPVSSRAREPASASAVSPVQGLEFLLFPLLALALA